MGRDSEDSTEAWMEGDVTGTGTAPFLTKKSQAIVILLLFLLVFVLPLIILY
ncbi:hypothetical protein [Haladaptatus sp. NG-SE-30]